MSGFSLKANADEVIDRHRRFFNRQLQDGILVSAAVMPHDSDWREYDRKWDSFKDGEARPLTSAEEIFEREEIYWRQLGRIEDDSLPVSYTLKDAGEGIIGGLFGGETRFIHRNHDSTYSATDPVLHDYSNLSELSSDMDTPLAQRVLGTFDYFNAHAGDRFSQHASLTIDALNFVCELRGSTQAYLDVYEYPEEMLALMEIGLDFNIRFQEAQIARITNHTDGCFVWLAEWMPFPRAISLSVDAYVITSPETYVEYGFDYQRRLLEHFGNGIMHFHCNRLDLAAEVLKLPNLRAFQFGGDSRDNIPDIEHLPEMRKLAGDMPLMLCCSIEELQTGLASHTLGPNTWYLVIDNTLSVDETNRLMESVRAYRA